MESFTKPVNDLREKTGCMFKQYCEPGLFMVMSGHYYHTCIAWIS